ncbi:MAG TPA: hypothetical protein VGY48_30825 [Vicinamibacterales bacterium]|nr:hypothetical protein [Vicinamibacterales bacterium]
MARPTWPACGFRGLMAAAFAISIAALAPVRLQGQTRGVVVDQTGLPLPGAHIELHRGEQTVASIDAQQDGGFELPATQANDVVVISLDGFETARVEPEAARRVVLLIAHATETTEVVASALTSSGASMEHLGSTMSAPLAQRLPTARPRILQSLPLLPAVVRGRDGLLRIGGTRPHESTLWIDGFDVTDPVSGTTALDLPVESVRGMAVLREPVAATFGDVIGSAASIETTPGGEQLKAGIQGFIPRPRLSHLGLGKIEAFFPRAYVGGRAGIARYFASAEFNFERVPVPGVTGRSGAPNIGTTGVTSFGRLDLQPSTRHTMTVEGLFAPATTTAAGLSTLRPVETVPNVDVYDLFGGVTDHLVLSSHDLLTLRAGVESHRTNLTPTGSGDAILTPDGWRQNWFSSVGVRGARSSLTAVWDRAGLTAAGRHTVSATAGLHHRSMEGTLSDQRIQILNAGGALVRSVQFDPAGPLNHTDTYGGGGLRDLWDVGTRLQVDLGLRLDAGAVSGGPTLGPRFGVRYLIDEAGRTTVRGSVGRYAGRVPLAAKAFGQFPSRIDSTYDPVTGTPTATPLVPMVGDLPSPRSDAIAIEIEHRFTPSLELQAGARNRHGSQLPTVDVMRRPGMALLSGIGESDYRELQLSLRKTWSNDSQLFLSYVRSSAIGEINDFGSLFTNLDAPLLEPGARAPTAADVPHRFRGWATISLPRRTVVSPAVEWRTGFPFSRLDSLQHYVGPPNADRFPSYFSADVTAFKTFDLLRRKADLGLQLFNVTSHFNPRDVVAVVDSPRFGELESSFGITVAGYMQVRWQ